MNARSLLRQVEALKNGKPIASFSRFSLFFLYMYIYVVAPFYLVYFKEDCTVSVLKSNAIMEEASLLEVGSLCHVKDK